MKEIVLGTNNQDKRRELASLLKSCGIAVKTLADFPGAPDVAENGRTFEANASEKARVYSIFTKRLTLADDSGLMVNALNGKPGVYSARFAGPGCTYSDNNRKLLDRLKNKSRSGRRAKFVSSMALYMKGKRVACVKGECRGTISFEPRGSNGFGYDPVFIPEGFKKTFAEISPGQKNKISHRGIALRKAKKIIISYLRSRNTKDLLG